MDDGSGVARAQERLDLGIVAYRTSGIAVGVGVGGRGLARAQLGRLIAVVAHCDGVCVARKRQGDSEGVGDCPGQIVRARSMCRGTMLLYLRRVEGKCVSLG